MAAMVGPGPLAPQLQAEMQRQLERHEKAASALVPREVPKALVRAVRAELRALLDGNLEENLTQVEQVAVRARELFMSIRGPGAQFVRGGPTPNAGGQQVVGGSVTSFSSPVVYSQPSYSNPEQFGASAIRQLVSLVPEIMSAQSNTPDKLMAAIALAEEKGHDDIAKALKKRLMGNGYGDEPKQLASSHEAHESHESHEVEANGASVHVSVAAVAGALSEMGLPEVGASVVLAAQS